MANKDGLTTIQVLHGDKVLSVAVRLRNTETKTKWLILLHGLQSDHRVYDSFFEDPKFSGYSIAAFDLIGFGDSDKPEDFSYDIKDQLDVVANALKILKIEKAYLIGHSYGGMIVTLALSEITKSLNAVVSLEGNLVIEDCSESAIAAPLKRNEFQGYYNSLKQRLKDLGSSQALCRLAALEKAPGYAFHKSAKSIVQWSQSSKLFEIFQSSVVPRLFLRSRDSHFHSRPHGPGIKIVEVHSSSHFMLLDALEETRNGIANFLNTL